MGLFYTDKRMIAKDHLGKTYKSFSDMCKAWGVIDSTVAARLERGLSIKEALTKKPWSREHVVNGHTYKNVTEVCKAYGISRRKMNYRLYELGLSLEEAVNKNRAKDKPEDIMDLCELRGYIRGWLVKYKIHKKDFDGYEQIIKSIDYYFSWFIDRIYELEDNKNE